LRFLSACCFASFFADATAAMLLVLLSLRLLLLLGERSWRCESLFFGDLLLGDDPSFLEFGEATSTVLIFFNFVLFRGLVSTTTSSSSSGA
jgi:hypothetical protein